MCEMCKGASIDEVRFNLHGMIYRSGWAVVPVVAESLERSWAYTVGLAGGFDHPELAVVGLSPTDAGRLLNKLGELVRTGSRLMPGDVVTIVGRGDFLLAGVRPDHFAGGTFAAWVGYYGALGPPHPRPAALEVVHLGDVPRLDRCHPPDVSDTHR